MASSYSTYNSPLGLYSQETLDSGGGLLKPMAVTPDTVSSQNRQVTNSMLHILILHDLRQAETEHVRPVAVTPDTVTTQYRQVSLDIMLCHNLAPLTGSYQAWSTTYQPEQLLQESDVLCYERLRVLSSNISNIMLT